MVSMRNSFSADEKYFRSRMQTQASSGARIETVALDYLSRLCSDRTRFSKPRMWPESRSALI